jgi:hypothetical protein
MKNLVGGWMSEILDPLEAYRERAKHYEFLYLEQKDIISGYRELVEEWKEKYMTLSEEYIDLKHAMQEVKNEYDNFRESVP